MLLAWSPFLPDASLPALCVSFPCLEDLVLISLAFNPDCHFTDEETKAKGWEGTGLRSLTVEHKPWHRGWDGPQGPRVTGSWGWPAMPADCPVGLPVLLSIGYTWVLGVRVSERAGDSGEGEVPQLPLLGRWGRMTQGSPPGGPEARVSSAGCTVYPAELTSPPGWTTRPLILRRPGGDDLGALSWERCAVSGRGSGRLRTTWPLYLHSGCTAFMAPAFRDSEQRAL